MLVGPVLAVVDLDLGVLDGPDEVVEWVDDLGQGGAFVRSRKVAEVVDGGLLAGVSDRRPYPYDALALCGKGKEHDAPDVTCSCGFYALRDHESSPYGAGRDRSVRVRVEIDVVLAGRAIFHETARGLLVRAERQYVLAVVDAPPGALGAADRSDREGRGPDGGVGALIDLAGTLPPPRDTATALAVPRAGHSRWRTGPTMVEWVQPSRTGTDARRSEPVLAPTGGSDASRASE